jgi:hypothetical protein
LRVHPSTKAPRTTHEYGLSAARVAAGGKRRQVAAAGPAAGDGSRLRLGHRQLAARARIWRRQGGRLADGRDNPSFFEKLLPAGPVKAP